MISTQINERAGDAGPDTEPSWGWPRHDRQLGEGQGYRYSNAYARMLSGYHDSSEDEPPWEIWSDGEFVDGPSYRTSEQARAAARYHQNRIATAGAELPAVEAALRAATAQLGELQRELAHSHPWSGCGRTALPYPEYTAATRSQPTTVRRPPAPA